jgi:hypothetical protein
MILDHAPTTRFIKQFWALNSSAVIIVLMIVMCQMLRDY